MRRFSINLLCCTCQEKCDFCEAFGPFGLNISTSYDSEVRQISFEERLHHTCHVERGCETAFCGAPCIYGRRRLFSA